MKFLKHFSSVQDSIASPTSPGVISSPKMSEDEEEVLEVGDWMTPTVGKGWFMGKDGFLLGLLITRNVYVCDCRAFSKKTPWSRPNMLPMSTEALQKKDVSLRYICQKAPKNIWASQNVTATPGLLRSDQPHSGIQTSYSEIPGSNEDVFIVLAWVMGEQLWPQTSWILLNFALFWWGNGESLSHRNKNI